MRQGMVWMRFAVWVSAWGLLTALAGNVSALAGEPRFMVMVQSREDGNGMVESRVRDHVIRSVEPGAIAVAEDAPTPSELLVAAMAACVVSSLRHHALVGNMMVDNIGAEVTGEVDFSRARSLSDLKRPGFSGFRIAVRFDADMSPDHRNTGFCATRWNADRSSTT